MAKRVFELAKDLDVTSKAILDKCRAEGIELKNHMAALSAGLVATIAEWFSEGSSATAVETSEHIDLSAAREEAKAERKRRRHTEGPKEAAEAGVAVEEVAEGGEPAEAQPAAQPAPTPVETVATAEPPVEADVVAAPEPVAEPQVHKAPVHEHKAVAPAAPVAAVVAADAPAETRAAAQQAPAVEHAKARREPEKKEEPPVRAQVGPAGPQVVPRPAKLQGPRVVRFAGVDADTSIRRPAPGYRAGTGNGGATPPSAPPRGGARPPLSTGRPVTAADEEEEKKKGAAKKRSPRRRDDARTVGAGGQAGQEWRNVDLAERSVRLAAASGSTLRRHRANVGQGRHDAAPVRPLAVEVEEPITVKSLSAAAGIKVADIIRKLMQQGTMATINATLPRETVELLAVDMGFEVHITAARTAENALAVELSQRQANPEKMTSRAPVVAFLGHVDHGKTSLMDRIRHATVAAGEEGGITQGIGSYRYDMGDKHVVFLDTPGHEAFTAMRARGANMTDVVVLVVAADDGVMPQTVEAINHAKAAGVPIVVALNKIDLPNANANKALGQLAEHGLNPRQWGGTTEVIETSATTGLGVDTLIETLSLEAELLELRSDPTAAASGWVMESRMDPSRGVAARCLVRDGTLRVGDVVLCGQSLGRVRSILDHHGKSIPEAGPASPVEISGLDEMPDAGDKFIVVDDLVQAREVAQGRRDKAREQTRNTAPTATLANMFEQIEAGKATEMRVIIKCDVQGSLEALRKSLAPLGSAEVRLNVLHSGVGGITEGDVLLAEASTAMILGFRVVADQRARALAETKGVEVRTYRVIYQLIEELEKALHGLLEPELTEKVLGRATIRELFKVSRVGTIAGCIVNDGTVIRNAKYRIIRDNVVVEDERSLDSLRRFKDDVREVRAGMECGMKVSGFDDLKVGDILEAYQSVEVARK